jgi:predicted Zn-dependent protease with MMP-like domain
MIGMTSQFDDRRARQGAVPSLADIEALAANAYSRLPAHFRALCEDLVIRVEDFPALEVVDAMGLRSRYDLLGLFQGIGLPFRSDPVSGQMPNMIWLYRRPILAYWNDRADSLAAIVTHVLVHEIGHHFGFSDADMEAIEASAE